MPYIANVAYPSAAGARFDMKYYLNKHMPLVQQTWGSHGLENWFVTEHSDATSPYSVQAVLSFKDKKSFEDCTQKRGEEVFGDIQNYTDLKPTLYHGEQVGAQKSD